MTTQSVKTLGASDVLVALAKKHDEDLFVPECKSGQGGARRLDAWVLKRTYSPWTTIGYEIKVTRQDFRRDEKWMEYLRLCHHFSFVCPAGLIHPNELPSGVGLMWVSHSGTIHTRKKAPRNEVDETSAMCLMIYVLMSRSVIVKNMGEANAKMLPETREQRTEEYRKLLSQAEERKELAEFVGKHVRDRYFEMKAKISIAERKDREAEELRTYLREHGVNWEPDFFGCSPWLAKQDIGRALGIIDDSQLDKLLERMARVATNTREELARLRESMSPIQQKRVG